MTNQKTETLGHGILPSGMDVGRPVEWMVDPEQRALILGVTYAFSQTVERKTVWYTPNKRRPRRALVVTELPQE